MSDVTHKPGHSRSGPRLLLAGPLERLAKWLLMNRVALLPIAWDLFARQGYAQVSMEDVARQAGISIAQLYRSFSRKEELVCELYHLLAVSLEERATDMPSGKLARRFGFLMDEKIASLERFRAPLQALFSTMTDADQDLGVMSAHLELIRGRVRALFLSAALGASDRLEDAELTARHLYRLHLGLIFLWFHSPLAYRSARSLVRGALELGSPIFGLPLLGRLLQQVDRLLQRSFEPHDSERSNRAEAILRRLFRRRRLQAAAGPCALAPCPQCYALQRERLQDFIKHQAPIQLVLPGFPAKSPNRRKALGPLPDTAEVLALRYLQGLCDEIAQLHSPGVNLILCSDGHVFSDLVGVSDAEVTHYNQAIRKLLEGGEFPSLQFFNLEDVFAIPDYTEIRANSLGAYSDSLEILRDRVQHSPAQRALFDGLHRFLFEDRLVLYPEVSRNQQRKQSKELTYQVLQRSNAWGRLVAQHFPRALRLSIHPQPAHSEKIGIQLAPSWEGSDAWITPWHGVAVLSSQGYRLLKRHQAEELGASLVEQEGRPLHFEMPDPRAGNA